MFDKVTLAGQRVRLEPLSEEHREGLCEAIYDGELWKLFVTLVPHPADIESFVDQALSAHAAGDGLAFASIDQASGRVVGSTRFMKACLAHRRLEIGFTFLAQSHQRSGINTEAKLLMLNHAFEALDLNRVELITDFLNQRSRQAILRLGAKEEGVLRSHMLMPDGRVRDSVIHSITGHEWPGIKQHLQYKLSQYAG